MFLTIVFYVLFASLLLVKDAFGADADKSIGTIYNVMAINEETYKEKLICTGLNTTQRCISADAYKLLASFKDEASVSLSSHKDLINAEDFTYGVFIYDPTADYFTTYNKNFKANSEPSDVFAFIHAKDLDQQVVLGSATQFIMVRTILEQLISKLGESYLEVDIVDFFTKSHSCIELGNVTDVASICNNFVKKYINSWKGYKITLLDVISNRAGLEDGFFNVYSENSIYKSFGSFSIDPVEKLFSSDSMPKINKEKIHSMHMTQSVYMPVIAYTIASFFVTFSQQPISPSSFGESFVSIDSFQTTKEDNAYPWWELNSNRVYEKSTKKSPFSNAYLGNGGVAKVSKIAEIMTNLLTGHTPMYPTKLDNVPETISGVGVIDAKNNFLVYKPGASPASNNSMLEYLVTTKYLDEVVPDFAATSEFPSRAIGGFRRANINHNTDLMLLDGDYPGHTVRFGYHSTENPLMPKFGFFISYNASDDNLLADMFVNWFATFFTSASVPNRTYYLDNRTKKTTTNKPYISDSVFVGNAIKQYSKYKILDSLTSVRQTTKRYMPDRVPKDSYIFPILSFFLKTDFKFTDSDIKIGNTETSYVQAQKGYFSPLDPLSSQLFYMTIDKTGKYVYTQDSVFVDVTNDYNLMIVYLFFIVVSAVLYIVLAVFVGMKKTKKSEGYWVETCFCISAKKREKLIEKHRLVVEKKLAEKHRKMFEKKHKKAEQNANMYTTTSIIDNMDLTNIDASGGMQVANIYNSIDVRQDGKKATGNIQITKLGAKTMVNETNSNEESDSYVYDDVDTNKNENANENKAKDSAKAQDDSLDFIKSADYLNAKSGQSGSGERKKVKKAKSKGKDLKQHKLGHILASKILVGIASLTLLAEIIGTVLLMVSVFQINPEYNMPFVSFNEHSSMHTAGFAFIWIEVLSFFAFVALALYEFISQWAEISKYWFGVVVVYILCIIFIIGWMISYNWLTSMPPKPIAFDY